MFASGEKFSIEELSRMLSSNVNDIEKAASELAADYETHAISLRRFGNYLRLATKPEYFDTIKVITDIKTPKLLTDTQLEALSIIAYGQPVDKLEIEKIRGVRSEKVINSLLDKKMIEEIKSGESFLYKTTDEFLRAFGFNSLSDLPDIGFVKEKKDATSEISLK